MRERKKLCERKREGKREREKERKNETDRELERKTNCMSKGETERDGKTQMEKGKKREGEKEINELELSRLTPRCHLRVTMAPPTSLSYHLPQAMRLVMSQLKPRQEVAIKYMYTFRTLHPFHFRIFSVKFILISKRLLYSCSSGRDNEN